MVDREVIFFLAFFFLENRPFLLFFAIEIDFYHLMFC
jgi:hypothetical protein